MIKFLYSALPPPPPLQPNGGRIWPAVAAIPDIFIIRVYAVDLPHILTFCLPQRFAALI